MPNTFRPSFDLSLHFPQLQKKTAVFMHPRHTTNALPAHVSKMGGHFYWPAAERWPTCPLDRRPMVPVIQLRKDDVPELGFPEAKNLFQLLWCPDQYHEDTNYGPYPRCVWRHVQHEDGTELLQPDQVPRPTPLTDRFAIPRPCAVHPERMEEYPAYQELEQISDTLAEQIDSWVAENAEQDLVALGELGLEGDDKIYEECWGACPNTKVGGWVYWTHDVSLCTCTECGSKMEHLLSISSLEYGGGLVSRWYPIDEPREQARQGTEMWLGDSERFVLFVCRACSHFPIRGKLG